MQLTLEEIQLQLDGLILATPTGELRNKLTDINILTLEALAMPKPKTRVNLAKIITGEEI